MFKVGDRVTVKRDAICTESFKGLSGRVAQMGDNYYFKVYFDAPPQGGWNNPVSFCVAGEESKFFELERHPHDPFNQIVADYCQKELRG